MTNEKMIANAALQHGLFTEEQIKAYQEAGRRLPLHTYAEWQRLGYQVKRGEHAALKLDLWQMGKAKQTQPDAAEQEEGTEPRQRFYLRASHLFLRDQVERIPQQKIA